MKFAAGAEADFGTFRFKIETNRGGNSIKATARAFSFYAPPYAYLEHQATPRTHAVHLLMHILRSMASARTVLYSVTLVPIISRHTLLDSPTVCLLSIEKRSLSHLLCVSVLFLHATDRMSNGHLGMWFEVEPGRCGGFGGWLVCCGGRSFALAGRKLAMWTTSKWMEREN